MNTEEVFVIPESFADSGEESLEVWGGRLLKTRGAAFVVPLLHRIDPSRLSAINGEMYYLYRSVCALELQNQLESLKLLQSGLASLPNSAFLNYLVGQDLLKLGKKDDGFACFSKAITKLGIEYGFAMLRYAYLWGEHEFIKKNVPNMINFYLHELRPSEYYTTRGLLDLPQFFHFLIGLEWPMKDYKLSENILSHLSAMQIGKSNYIRMEYQAIRSHNLEAYENIIYSNKIFKLLKLKWFLPDVYKTRFTFIEGVLADSLKKGFAILGKVPVLRVPWFSTVLLAGKASLYHRFGDVANEQSMTDALLQNQTHLLEPYWATYFGLLEYQEHAKKEYRRRAVRLGEELM